MIIVVQWDLLNEWVSDSTRTKGLNRIHMNALQSGPEEDIFEKLR